MIRKNSDSSKGKELLKLIEPELNNSRLRDVIDYEVHYMRRYFESELAEKDEVLLKKDMIIVEKDKIILELQEKLAENGIK